MSRGYIVIAQNSGKVDYLSQAYALALNLKLTQSTVNNIAVCVDSHTKKMITEKHKNVFDHIIDIPWEDAAQGVEWKINNKWKYYYMSPFDETVILDTDMIFPNDVSFWWDHLSVKDVWACTNVKTYRNEIIVDNYYRTYFKKNNLPNVYTAFFYFKKSDTATELFKMIEIVFNNWERFFFKYMPKGKPEWLSGDVAYALAIQLLGIEEECTMDHITEMPTFVHMKSYVQNIPTSLVADEWSESIPCYYKDYTNFKVGNFKINYPFHYVDKDWMTKEKIQQLEVDYFGKRTNI